MTAMTNVSPIPEDVDVGNEADIMSYDRDNLRNMIRLLFDFSIRKYEDDLSDDVFVI